MNIYCRENDLILEEVFDFDIEDTLECGQCFHFTRLAEKEYELVAFGKYLHIKQCREENAKADSFILYDTSVEDFNEIWKSYFDLDTDYGVIKESIIKADERLADVILKHAGIRILRQDFFEMLISFIISQNKKICHIKQIVHLLSEKYGQQIVTKDGRMVYAFPSVEALFHVSEEELRGCKVGFRAPYIRQAVCSVHNGEIDGDILKNMPFYEARKSLMSIKGVGEKVANCVLLFGLSFASAFPVDVWMKRIMEELYFHEDTKNDVIEKYAVELFGNYAGYAQQYLFIYGRDMGVGK
ncbi:MAG: N-glycosylase [Clostridium sp.]|nr:N-glycosylase [Clostridium sp.]